MKKRRIWNIFLILFLKWVMVHSSNFKGTPKILPTPSTKSAPPSPSPHSPLQRTSWTPTGCPNSAETPAGLKRTSVQSWGRGMFASSLTALNSLMISRRECSWNPCGSMCNFVKIIEDICPGKKWKIHRPGRELKHLWGCGYCAVVQSLSSTNK